MTATVPISRELLDDSWTGDERAWMLYQLGGQIPSRSISVGTEKWIAVPDYEPLFRVMQRMYQQADKERHHEATRRLSPLEAIKRVFSR